MNRIRVIFALLSAVISTRQLNTYAQTAGGAAQSSTSAAANAAPAASAVAPVNPAPRNPVVIPPTTPVVPPTTPVFPPTTPVIPPGVEAAPGQITTPTVPGTQVPNNGLTVPPGPTNLVVNPNVQRTLPPGAGTLNRTDTPDFSRRTQVPPTLLRNRTNITPAQRAQINRLANELAIFRPGLQFGPQQKSQLMNSLAAAGNTTSPLSQAALGAMSDHLGASLSNLTLTPQQRQQLAIDLNMLFYSGKLTPSDTQMVIEDARNLLQGAGANAEGVTTLTADFATISQALQNSNAAATTLSPAQTQP